MVFRDEAFRVIYGHRIPPIDEMLRDATKKIEALREELESSNRDVNILKAMLEQVNPPKHDSDRCGSNDCPACEFHAFATNMGWPPWLEDFCPERQK